MPTPGMRQRFLPSCSAVCRPGLDHVSLCVQSRPQRHSSFGAVSEPATPLPLSFRGQQLLSETGSADGWADPGPPRMESETGQYTLDRKVGACAGSEVVQAGAFGDPRSRSCQNWEKGACGM